MFTGGEKILISLHGVKILVSEGNPASFVIEGGTKQWLLSTKQKKEPTEERALLPEFQTKLLLGSIKAGLHTDVVLGDQ